jgi:hypothetical protein
MIALIRIPLEMNSKWNAHALHQAGRSQAEPIAMIGPDPSEPEST